LRDEAALEASCARARHVYPYESECDIARLAGAYGYGIVRNHPFNDGNKRAGFLAIGLFLSLKRRELTVPPAEAIAVVFRLAEGKLTELELAEWIRQNSGAASS
jgi:death-on-curing protein